MERVNIEREKLINAILFFSKELKNPNKTNILKALFNSEFTSVRRVGRPIFGLKYYAWKYGPVPKDLYYEIEERSSLKDCEDRLVIIEQRKDDDYGYKEYIFKPKYRITPNLEFFSDTEIKILNEIAFIYKNELATTTSKITHEPGTPWARTKETKGEGGLIDYELAFDIEDENKLDIEVAKDRLKTWEWFAENFPVEVACP